ncbi:uncharacterized protein LOC135212502 isoform X2 [Macrobrachium nipponense]|uniref:uncharacterized protein LOC135212502 isoform X2 n=1 Tax=Macrobrachium nipponense TaxID=159736 RepID=UPI0030C7F8E4
MRMLTYILILIVQLLTASRGQVINGSTSGNNNLAILLNVTFPLRDTNFYLVQFEKLIQSNFEVSVLSSLGAEVRNEVLQLAGEQDLSSIVGLLEREDKLLRTLAKKAGNKGEKSWDSLKKTDYRLKEMGLFLRKGDPGLRNFKADPIAKNNSRVGFIMEEATRVFKKKLRLSDRAVTVLVFLKKIKKYLEERFSSLLVTPKQSPCNPLQPYRTLNGMCNNLQDAIRGSTFTKFRRILFPDYFKGVSELRRDQNGDLLPSPRHISTGIDGHTSIESTDLSSYHMTFGQFLDHDITSTPMTKIDTLSYGTIIKCCDPTLNENPELTKDAESIGCATIDIPKGDYFYSSYGQRCMEFLRSLPAGSLVLGPREQVNSRVPTWMALSSTESNSLCQWGTL